MTDAKEEMTLDAYVKKERQAEGKNSKKDGKKKVGVIRRTGNANNRGNNKNRNNTNRSGGKPRQNSQGGFNGGNNNRQVVKERIIYKEAPQKIQRPIPQNKKRIVKVYNLVPSVDNETFYELFVKYGSIEQSKIETDKKGKSEERGYVVYRDNDAANRAISDLNGAELEGRIITVEFMKDGEKLTTSTVGREATATPQVPLVKKAIVKEDRYPQNNNRGNNRNNNNGNNRGNQGNFNKRNNSNGGNNNNNKGNRKFNKRH